MSAYRHPVVLWAFALALAAGFASLGAWQLGRQDEKRAMLDAAAAVLADRQPQAIEVLGDPVRRERYDWIALQGRFADMPAVLLDNQRRGNAVGVRAYRVFLARSSSQPGASVAPLAVLVELGWLPLPADRRMPRIPLPLGDFELQGLVLPPPGLGLSLGPPAVGDDGTLLATGLQTDALAAALGLEDLSMRVFRPEPDAAFGAGAPAYIRDFDILPNTLPPERHLGYAVQWFALSATVVFVALLLTLRTIRRRARSPETLS